MNEDESCSHKGPELVSNTEHVLSTWKQVNIGHVC